MSLFHRTASTASIGGRQLIVTLFVLAGVLLAIQFISSVFDQRNERIQERRTLNDGSAPVRDHLMGL